MNPGIQTGEERKKVTNHPTISGSYFCLYFNLDHESIGYEEVMKEKKEVMKESSPHTGYMIIWFFVKYTLGK